MSARELIAPTPRRKMTRQRAAKIFLRENGQCYVCLRKLRVGADKYQIEHPDPLCLGGSDDDADLRVICDDCHKPKTAADAATRAKRDRIITAAYRPDDERPPSRLSGPRFRKSPPQNSATRAIVRRSERNLP